MRKKVFTIAALAILCTFGAFAQDAKPQFKWYGFIRNYYAFDTRESTALTEDFFYYVPKDISENAFGEDINANPNFKFAALTSRLGLDVTGYEYKGWKMGAKIETDFYSGLSATSNDPLTKSSLTGAAVLRLRQAFLTVSNDTWTLKAGQAWHPMAADLPDVFSLNTGAPFGPFSRTPLISVDAKASENVSFTLASIWQQQYTSAGPYGASANYIRNGGGEFYFGVNYTTGDFLFRGGLNVLSISPRTINDLKKKVNEHITTVTPFIYAQYKYGKFSAKFKTVYAQAGEHVNLNGGYAVTADTDLNGDWKYTPTRNSSSWMSLMYSDNGWQYILFGGYVKNFGTAEAVKDAAHLYFSKNSFNNFNSMWRLTPTIIKSFGKFAIGLEYELTSVCYGDMSKGFNAEKCLYDKGLHNVVNHRIQSMLKFTF